MEDIVKKINVTFTRGLPFGDQGTFKHDGQSWTAYPTRKQSRILAVVDRLLGSQRALGRDMVAWLNTHPEDAERVLMLIERINDGAALYETLVVEKVDAITS